MQLNCHAKARGTTKLFHPTKQKQKVFVLKNEPIIPQKMANPEEFKNPKIVSQKESKREIMLHKNKGNPSKPTPREREEMIKQNWNKKNPAHKIFWSYLAK